VTEAPPREDELLLAVHPRPWNWTWIAANAAGGGHIYLTDDNGRKIAALWGSAGEKKAAAELIVMLVNNAGPF
jgi:hypothetical protein